MARTIYQMGYRKNSTDYKIRTYDSKESAGLALTAMIGGRECYAPLVDTTSPYASDLRVYHDGEWAVAKLMPEYKATWTSVGSALNGSTTTLSAVSLDYDLVYSTSNLANIAIGFETYGGFTGIVTVNINGTPYSYVITGPAGTYYYLFRENPSYIGTGEATDNTIILYSSQTKPPDDVPLGYNSYALRVAP